MIMLAHGMTVALACAPVNEGPEAILEFGVIDENDMHGVHFVETAQEAWQYIRDWYQLA